MRRLFLVGSALLAGAVGGSLGLRAGAGTEPATSRAAAPSFDAAARLRTDEASALERRLARLEGRIATLELEPEPEGELPNTTASDEEIEAALQRWRSAHGALPGQLAPAVEQASQAQPLAELSTPDLLAAFSAFESFGPEVQQFVERVRDAGRMDDLLALLEERALADPGNSGLQVELANAYLEALFGLPPSPESGRLAAAADAAYDRALEADPENVEARYLKAISLSHWPPFLGKTGEAIEEFERVVATLEARGDAGGYGDSYLYLGNLYQQSGDQERALATWRAGLALDPGNDELAARLAEARDD